MRKPTAKINETRGTSEASDGFILINTCATRGDANWCANEALDASRTTIGFDWDASDTTMMNWRCLSPVLARFSLSFSFLLPSIDSIDDSKANS